ncbi:MAG: hypothetical protein AB1458_01940 [Bacteroidota bacterium]
MEFVLNLEKGPVILKAGLAKSQISQLLGTRRAVEIDPVCETENWYYCFRGKLFATYCTLCFRKNSLVSAEVVQA